jgi:hydrogenase maturation factor HypF (carbamoyltransferase family)
MMLCPRCQSENRDDRRFYAQQVSGVATMRKLTK